MSLTWSVNRAFTVAAAVAITAGCATQSDAFRRMSAEEHERAGAAPGDPLAGDHAAAAQDLRRNELAACVDVSDADRDQGPLARRDRIAGVEILRDRLYPKWPEQAVGVAVYVRATPGMTEQWMGRVVECHLAHQAVLGTADNQTCPLGTYDSRVRVSSTSTGFRVAITSRDPAVARSVVERCRALAD